MSSNHAQIVARLEGLQKQLNDLQNSRCRSEIGKAYDLTLGGAMILNREALHSSPVYQIQIEAARLLRQLRRLKSLEAPSQPLRFRRTDPS